MKKRTIGIVTTTRADYGLYQPVLKLLSKEKSLNYFMYVSGTHLCAEFANTVKVIEKDGHPIIDRIPMLLASDTPEAIAESMGLGTLLFARSYAAHRPDILLVLGDRFEMHAAVAASIPFGIPLAHIHGGEVTRGAMDDVFRHSITKMSHMHFATTKTAAKRIIAMGENPDNVHLCGAPGIDNIKSVDLLSRKELNKRFGFPLTGDFLLATFHPVTMEYKDTPKHIEAMLDSIAKVDMPCVFTGANTDTYGSMINQAVKSYVAKANNGSVYIENLGTQGYLSAMSTASAMVGNSSSGIIEAASFKLPVVNIGSRQEGREQSGNVVNCGYSKSDISKAIATATSLEFKKKMAKVKNVYGDGTAAGRIVNVLKAVDTKNITSKMFYDSFVR